MKALTRFGLISFAVGLYVGCSPVKFSLDSSKCNDIGQPCVVEEGKYSVGPTTITAGAGKVDILIVNDNSASMSFEQKRMAPRFATFISDLDARKVDYRIAMTTTDVVGNNGGKLVFFDAGTAYLTPRHANRQALFNQAIQRPETRNCENFIADYLRKNGKNSINTSAYSAAYAQNCPSGDERGVYQANLVVSNNPSGFIRPDAHLSVIFLSDEDVRSGLYGSQGYTLDTLDQPYTLANNVKNTLGIEKYNSFTVHAIVVQDQACLSQQNTQILGDNPNPDTYGLVTGSIGTVYLQFPLAGWGRAVSICSNDYSTDLGQIRTSIAEKTQTVLLACANPTDLIVTGTSVGYTTVGKALKFAQALPPGTSITLSYKCDSL
ncbi:hypothetical protein D3C87_242180 [compost metagenome]